MSNYILGTIVVLAMVIAAIVHRIFMSKEFDRAEKIVGGGAALLFLYFLIVLILSELRIQ